MRGEELKPALETDAERLYLSKVYRTVGGKRPVRLGYRVRHLGRYVRRDSMPGEFLDRPGTAQILAEQACARSRGPGTPRAVGRKCAMSAMGAAQFCPWCAAVPRCDRLAGPRLGGTPRRSERLVHLLRRGSPVLRARQHRRRRGCLQL
jgi:hypothetical protein